MARRVIGRKIVEDNIDTELDKIFPRVFYTQEQVMEFLVKHNVHPRITDAWDDFARWEEEKYEAQL